MSFVMFTCIFCMNMFMEFVLSYMHHRIYEFKRITGYAAMFPYFNVEIVFSPNSILMFSSLALFRLWKFRLLGLLSTRIFNHIYATSKFSLCLLK